MATRLKEKYLAEAVPALQQKFGYKNVMQIPRLEKIIINIGLGDCKDNAKAFETAIAELAQISGQKPMVTKAKKSIANFKVREGMNVGAKVTLRGARMEQFMDKLVSIALPRVRDFSGVSTKAFDGRGNYSRHGNDFCHHGQDRRGSQGAPQPARYAVRALREGITKWQRPVRRSVNPVPPSSPPGLTPAAACAAVPIPFCAVTACAASASGNLLIKDRSPVFAKRAGKY